MAKNIILQRFHHHPKNQHHFQEPGIASISFYAQLKPKELSQIKGVDLVIGDNEKLNVANHVLNNYHNNNSKIVHSPISHSLTFKSSFSMNERIRSYLKIQDGCDYPCTYCTIPEARGKSRSDTINNIIRNLKIMKKNNVSEVVLTGVNIGYYKEDTNKGLINLL